MFRMFFFMMALIPLAAIGILVGSILFGVKIIRGTPKRSKEEWNDETKMIQEIYEGLTNMEDRIAALETILMESERKE